MDTTPDITELGLGHLSEEEWEKVLEDVKAEPILQKWQKAAPDWVRCAYRNDQMVHAFVCRCVAGGITPQDGLPMLYEFIYGQYLLSHGQLLERIMKDMPNRVFVKS